MKKAVILLIVTVITVCLFVSCSVKNSGSGDNSTTAVTDTNGETHYYKTVTDENGEVVTDSQGNTVYAEIVTDSNNNAVTNENKVYITNENTTVIQKELSGETTKLKEKADAFSENITISGAVNKNDTTESNTASASKKEDGYNKTEDTTNISDVTNQSQTSISQIEKEDSADNEIIFEQSSEFSTKQDGDVSTTVTSSESTTNSDIPTTQSSENSSVQNTESTTESKTTTQSVTDKDGWINKWY